VIKFEPAQIRTFAVVYINVDIINLIHMQALLYIYFPAIIIHKPDKELLQIIEAMGLRTTRAYILKTPTKP
jgi:hypothetical protein